MLRGRMYSSALNAETGEIVLPWVSLVMASLLLKGAMTPPEICMDLTFGNEDIAKQLNVQVNGCVKKLEDRGFLLRLSGKKLKPTARGKKEFQAVMDRAAKCSSWKLLSDSKLLT